MSAPAGDRLPATVSESSPVSVPASVVATAVPSLSGAPTALPDPRNGTSATTGVVPVAGEVRTVLEGYRTAYNQLDAAGAKAVWPSVDVKTLSKAFDQLQSQEIKFTSCWIAQTGDSVRAVCGGNATFVPKIGSRSSRSASREWNFALRRSGDRWVIAGVDIH